MGESGGGFVGGRICRVMGLSEGGLGLSLVGFVIFSFVDFRLKGFSEGVVQRPFYRSIYMHDFMSTICL